MRFVGIDLHKVNTQICALDDETGEVVEKRIKTETGTLQEFFAGWPRCRIVLESATESEWVARVLEQAGHEVIVADPNFAPMYATRSKKVKTDKRDARALAEAARIQAYRPAHRVSDTQRLVRHELTARDALVGSRTKLICTARALTRQHGLRVPSGEAETFHTRVRAMTMDVSLANVLAPMLDVLELLTGKIGVCDKRIGALGESKVTQQMQTVPNIGPVTSVAFVATLDDAKRFGSARQVAAYLGIVPSESSSGEKQSRGRITKRGNARMRWLLVQAGHGILRRRTPANEPLHVWARAVEMRRGKKIAVVALARRLARILFAIWRDGTTYNPRTLAPPAKVAA